jgi:hypothetical protein
MYARMEKRAMSWFRRVAELRTLTGKRDLLGYPLAPIDSARLEELERFFFTTADPARSPFSQRGQRRHAILAVVSFQRGPRMAEGTARDLSADGVFVETRSPLPVGTRTVVRVLDRSTGDEWRFGGDVVRVEHGDRPGMAVRFVGIPLSLRLGHRTALPSGGEDLRSAA